MGENFNLIVMENLKMFERFYALVYYSYISSIRGKGIFRNWHIILYVQHIFGFSMGKMGVKYNIVAILHTHKHTAKMGNIKRLHQRNYDYSIL